MNNYTIYKSYNILTKNELEKIINDGFIDGDCQEMVKSFNNLEDAEAFFEKCEASQSAFSNGACSLIGYDLIEEEDGTFIKLIESKIAY